MRGKTGKVSWGRTVSPANVCGVSSKRSRDVHMPEKSVAGSHRTGRQSGTRKSRGAKSWTRQELRNPDKPSGQKIQHADKNGT